MKSPGFEQRLRDLDDNIGKDLALLKDFEDALRYETNPRIKSGYQREISQLRESANRYQQEFTDLQAELAEDPLATTATVSGQLNQIDTKLNLLLASQSAVHEDLVQMRQALLDRYDANEQVIVAVLSEGFDQTQIALTQVLLNGLETNQIPEPEMQQMLAVIEERIPSLPPSQASVAEVIKSPNLDAKHKLKVTLPIVPFIVDYEGELELGAGFDIKAAWEQLIAKMRRR
jgi:hypothetical protein